MNGPNNAYPERYADDYSPEFLDALIKKYANVFLRFDIDDPEKRIALALSWHQRSPETCGQWQERTLEARKAGKIRALKEGAKGAKTIKEKITLFAEAKLMQSLDVTQSIVTGIPEGIGIMAEATLRNPLDPAEGMQDRTRSRNDKRLRRDLAAAQGGYVTSAGRGIKKFNHAMLGFDVYVVNKGVTLGVSNSVIGNLRGEDTEVECFVVGQTGFRVVKEPRHWADWLSQNEDRYLVRSIGAGGVIDQKAHDRAVQVEKKYDREAKRPKDEPLSDKYRPGSTEDDLTGQTHIENATTYPPQKELGPMRLALEIARFQAILADADQFQVISQGTQVLDLIRRAVGISAGGVGGTVASHAVGEELAGQGEAIRGAAETVGTVVETADFLNDTVIGELKSSKSRWVEAVFSWQGGQASVATQARYFDCTDELEIGGEPYWGIRIGSIGSLR